MKSSFWVAAAFVLFFLAAPIRTLAQTVPDGTSPQSHAFFEVEYAREATYLSLSKPNQQSVIAISESLKSGSISYQNAAGQINKLLTPREQNAVLEVESSFWGALRGFQQANA